MCVKYHPPRGGGCKIKPLVQEEIPSWPLHYDIENLNSETPCAQDLYIVFIELHEAYFINFMQRSGFLFVVADRGHWIGISNPRGYALLHTRSVTQLICSCVRWISTHETNALA